MKTWLEDTLRPFSFLAEMRERQQVKRTCNACLELYLEARRERPDRPVLEINQSVVARRTGADPRGTHTILRRAEESFAKWPVERPLSFRDVVQYLVCTECLSDTSAESGIRTRVADVVTALIPGNL